MKKLRRYRTLISLAVIGVTGLLWFALSHWQPRTITEITQERSPQLGHFPVYKAILRPHQSTYIGKSGTTMIGTWVSYDVDYDLCVSILRHSGFFGLWYYYFTLDTDMAGMTTSAAYPGGRKTVEEYGGAGPKRLEDLQTQIENAVAKAHWHKVSSSTTYPADD